MKKYLFLATLILPSCSLFSDTPDSVVQGQRGVYQGLLTAEQNDEILITAYIEDNKKAVTYHINFITEPRIEAIRLNPNLSKEEKSAQITVIEQERDTKIQQAFIGIESRAKSMRDKAMENLNITKRLTESVYNYISTSPIEIDNIEYWIEKLKEGMSDNGR